MTGQLSPAADTVPAASARVSSGWQDALKRRAGDLGAWLRAERVFVIVALAGALLRALAELGYRPIMWFNDGFEYLGVALRLHPYLVRPDGYSFFLRALLPFHSFALVAALQHLMGLATALMIYLLLRHWNVRRWLATLAVVPQLLDVHQIELEHLLLSDTLFLVLLAGAAMALAWRTKPAAWQAGVGGLLLALATLTRTVGVPILVLVLVYLLVRRIGWRSLVAFLAAAVIPLGGYAAWNHSAHGSYALNSADGIFLYSRTQAFADCAKMHPPASIAMLCDQRPLSMRPPSSNYIWHSSPLDNLPGAGGETALPEQRFSTLRNDKALSFAIRAITSQPLSYLHVGMRDFARSFAWGRSPFPNKPVLHDYQFTKSPHKIDVHRVAVAGGTELTDTTAYEHANANTRVHQPYADALIAYQHVGYLPGPLLAALLLLGLGGTVAYRVKDARRWQAAFMVGMALALLLVPPFTAQFDYRYVMPAEPFAGAAAALAVAVLLDHRASRRAAGRSAREPAAVTASPDAVAPPEPDEGVDGP